MKEELDEKLLAALKIAENISDKNERPDAPDADAVMHSLMEELVAETRAEAVAEGVDPEKLRNNFFREKQENKAKPKKETDKEREALELADLLKRETDQEKETDRKEPVREAEPVSKKPSKALPKEQFKEMQEPERPVHAPKKLKDPWSRKKKTAVGILIGLILLIGIPSAIWMAITTKGKNRLEENAKGEKVSFYADGSSSTSIVYKGDTYVYNDDVISILVFGVDDSAYEEPEPEPASVDPLTGELVSTEEQDLRSRDDALIYTDANGSEYVRYGGRVDLCFLFVFDLKNDTLQIININRDSMTDVNVCTTQGETAFTAEMQAGLAYSYGDGGTVSCENFTQTVSNLFYGLPIHGYVALDMEAMKEINDVVDGVTLIAKETVSADVFEKDCVTLKGEDAYAYLEQMDAYAEEPGAHEARMDRQSQYAAAWLERFTQLYENHKNLPKEIYQAAEPYMQTNLTKQAVLYLFSRMRDMNVAVAEDAISEISGTYERPVHFDEYRIDKEKLVEQMLGIFYVKK